MLCSSVWTADAFSCQNRSKHFNESFIFIIKPDKLNKCLNSATRDSLLSRETPVNCVYVSSAHAPLLFPELHQGPPETLKRGAGDQHADPGLVRHPAGHGAGQLCGRCHLEQGAH